ncbi:hypothetical protein [Nodularia chucula]|uniref:hypothetical protein n=1 Tax=Nodularia chucula TaxID=3093667 RepID=UPI0039C6E231
MSSKNDVNAHQFGFALEILKLLAEKPRKKAELENLLCDRGFASGDLSQKITRVIGKLRDCGFNIKGVPNRPYELLESVFPVILSAEQRQALAMAAAKTPGLVCLIRTRKDMTETVPFQEITTTPEFSIAQVVEGDLLGTHTQSAKSLLFPTPASAYLPYATEFLGTVDPDGKQRLYAAQNLPTIDPTWDNNIRQQLDTYGCILDQNVPN